MRVKKAILILGCLLAVGFNGVGYADSAHENATLALIVHQLDMLNPLINQAQSEQDPRARVQFNYKWLRQDLAQIKAGINQKLGQIQIQPRVVAPIQGDYLNLKSTRYDTQSN